MKLTLFTLLALCLIAVCRSAGEEYDYEEEPAPVTPAPTKPPGRLGLLSARGRAPAVGRKPAAVATSTTPKPAEQPVEEEEDLEEALEGSQEQEDVAPTTTENPKKIRGGVRPFRSNEDLLAALKRRRAQVGTASHTKEHTTHAPVESTSSKSKSSSNNRIKNTNGGDAAVRPTSRGRFGSSRVSKPVQEEVEETQREEIKAKPYRRG